MENKKELRRRSIRLKGRDYTAPGAYFVTICAGDRREIFGTIQNGQVTLSAVGKIARGCVIQISNHFSHASVEAFVVMPNHVHMVIGVRARYIVPVAQPVRTPEKFGEPVAGSIPTIIRSFKAAVARQVQKELGMVGRTIWQKNYFERVLRNGKEYADASRYVAENPSRWDWDEENLKQESPKLRGKLMNSVR